MEKRYEIIKKPGKQKDPNTRGRNLWVYPTESTFGNLTMKITSGSAAGAGTSKGSTTGAETAGFGAAGAAAGGGGKAGSSRSAITNEAGGGCAARRNLNTPFTELRRTGQEAAKTELFEARAARHYAWQHAGPAGRN